jgi:hypothetical protein
MPADPERPAAVARLLGDGGMLGALGGGDAAVERDRALQVLDSANCDSALAMSTECFGKQRRAIRLFQQLFWSK